MLPENETITFEDQIYLNPQTALDESNTFIDNLRAVQQANNQAINTDLENLGTYPAAQSNLGGLLGGSGYFTSRYQVPQTVALTNDLRAAAQASALNQALQNEQAKWKQRYNKAYRNYQRRARNRYGGGGGGYTTTPTTPQLPIQGGVDETPNNGGITVPDDAIKGISAPRAGVSDTSYYQDGNWVTEYSDGSKYINGKRVRGSYAEQNAGKKVAAVTNVARQMALNNINPNQLTNSQKKAIANYVATYGKSGGGW